MTQRSANHMISPGISWKGSTNSSIQAITARLNLRTILTGFALAFIFFGFLAAIQYVSPNLAGNDGYYHIKQAYLMRVEGFKPLFDYLPLTVLNADEFVDHHFLFHLLLIPFTFGDLLSGVKLASVIFPGLTFLSVWWLLRSQRVPFAALWSIGLLVVSEAFLFRMSMPRAQSLSLLFLVWALYFLFNQKYHWLLPLGFFYVWLYNAFPLLVVVVLAYVVAGVLIEKQIRWQPLAYASAGIGLGLVINPYFPDNLLFIYRHLAPKLGDPTSTPVGNEWYPYKTDQLLGNSGLALISMLIGMTALGLNKHRMRICTATSLFLVFVFGYMLFQSRRFIEYTPAFVVIFSAFAVAPLLTRWLGRGALQGTTNHKIRDWLPPKLAEVTSGSAWREHIVGGLMIIIVIPALFINLSASRKSFESNAKPYTRYAQASAWLVANTLEDSRVFQTDWDDFPRLFFYNTHNTYTLGLDPTYMELYDAELYKQWVAITKGNVEQPSTLIHGEFGSDYVFTDLNHTRFLSQAEQDLGMLEVYRDDDVVLFEIVNIE
jgi:hypothetical protein